MKETNNEVLLKHLKAGNIVTTRTAPTEIGIADVRANIRDLRDLGYPILDKWVSGENRRGRKTRYKEYWLEKRKADIGFWDKDGEYQEEIVEVDEEELRGEE